MTINGKKIKITIWDTGMPLALVPGDWLPDD